MQVKKLNLYVFTPDLPSQNSPLGSIITTQAEGNYLDHIWFLIFSSMMTFL